jgi:hypothetical protein
LDSTYSLTFFWSFFSSLLLCLYVSFSYHLRYLKQRANDAESPLVKAKLNDDGDRLQQKAQSFINHINKSTQNPNDQNTKKDLESFVCFNFKPTKIIYIYINLIKYSKSIHIQFLISNRCLN